MRVTASYVHDASRTLYVQGRGWEGRERAAAAGRRGRCEPTSNQTPAPKTTYLTPTPPEIPKKTWPLD
jgi:hypothetical protein